MSATTHPSHEMTRNKSGAEDHSHPAKTITVEQAGRELGISRGLAYEGVRTGAIPAVRVGRRYLVPRAALDRLLAGDAA